MNHQSDYTRRLKRLKWGITGLSFLSIFCLELYYYLRGVPLTEVTFDFTIGITIALILIEIFYRYAAKLHRTLENEIAQRITAQEERERYIGQLEKALDDVKVLSGLLPICAYCKKIRDDKGYWQQIEEYISTHSDADFSHSICPDCIKKHFPGYNV